MNSEEPYCPPKSSYKATKSKIHRICFYFIHILLVCVAFVPTVFFVYHLYLPEHERWERMSSDGSVPTALSPAFFNNDETVEGPTLNNNSTNNTQATQQCNAPLVVNQSSNQCFAPCDWTSITPLTQMIYYGLVAVGLWLAVFATLFIMFTWSRIQSLRKFPHIVRFYVVICCIFLSCCKMLPLRIGLKKVYCGKIERWSPEGQASLAITLQGASCHYFTLVLCFWSTCFIANTYFVVVKGNRMLFERSVLVHIVQSLVCWVFPAIIVAICIYAQHPTPAYKMMFVDFMSAGPSGDILTYLSVTLPMQITLSVSLCLLFSVTWCIRRSRLDHTRHAIRADKDTQSMLRIERQFTSMKVLILLMVGVVLSVTTMQEYRVEKLIYLAQKYFDCLQYSKYCQEPNLLTPLYAIIILAPGFLCIILFFLLFMNKECRKIWASCFQRIARIANITKPRSETTKSRCSSTLTVLNDRRLSEVTTRNNSMRGTRLRTSSTPNLMLTAVGIPSPLELQRRTYLSPLALEGRPRSSSTPLRFMIGGDDTGSEQDLPRVASFPATGMDNQAPSHFNIDIQIISDAEGVTSVEECYPGKGDRYGTRSQLENDRENVAQQLIPGCVPELVDVAKRITSSEDKRFAIGTKTTFCKEGTCIREPLDCKSETFLGVCSTRL